MSSKFDIGDDVTIDGAVVKIVKIVANDDSITPLYLVQDINKNRFTYQTEDRMSISGSRTDKDDGSVAACRKRKKIGSSIVSESSLNSTPSAKNWSREQKERFNIEFLPNNVDITPAFHAFFEQEFPEHDDVGVKKLVEMRWDEPLPEDIHSNWCKLIAESYEFELQQSEASVENFVKILLELFDLNWSSSKVAVKFGIVDMILYAKSSKLMNCAVVVKGPAAYNIYHREKCRNQLSAYLISMAIENAHNLDVEYGQKFSNQNLLGIIHIGLTPIFYKTKISNQYLEAILPLHEKFQNESASKTSIPKLVIHEFAPIKPYTDREILRSKSSRSKIFKCYKAFQTLADNYAGEKLKSMMETG